MSGNDELFSALNSFKNEIKQTQFTLALRNAQDQVRGIKNSSVTDQEKVAQTRQVADSLAPLMVSQGFDHLKIAQLMSSLGAPQVKDSRELAAFGAATGNPFLVEQAAEADKASSAGEMGITKFREEQQNERLDRTLNSREVLAGQRLDLGMKQEQFNTIRDEKTRGILKQIFTEANPQTARSHTNIAKMGLVANRLQETRAILNDPAGVDRIGLQKIASSLNAAINQAAPTVTGTEETKYKSSFVNLQNKIGELTNTLPKLSMEDAKKSYNSIIDNVEQTASEITKKAQQKHIATLGGALLKRSRPNDFKMLRLETRNFLNQDISVGKNGKLKFNDIVSAKNKKTGEESEGIVVDGVFKPLEDLQLE